MLEVIRGHLNHNPSLRAEGSLKSQILHNSNEGKAT